MAKLSLMSNVSMNWLASVRKRWEIYRRGSESAGDYAFLVALIAASAVASLPVFVPWLFPVPSGVALLLGLVPFVLIGLRAVYRLFRVRMAIQGELACLQRFCTNAKALWTRLKPSPNAQIGQTEIFELVEAPLRRQAPHATKLIEQIAAARIDLIDAPSDSISRPFRDDLEGGLRDVFAHASLSTRFGILGTFIGFVGALFSLGALFAGLGQGTGASGGIDWSKWSLPIQVTLNDLAFAFVTSIYGLALAVLIQFLVSGARHPLDKLYELFDEALSYGREFVNRMTLADPAIHASLTQVRNSLKSMEQRLYNHGESVAAALKEHGNMINDESKRFAAAAQGMVDVQRQWDGALARLKDAANVFDARTADMIAKVETGLTSAATKLDQSLQALDVGQRQLAEAGAAMSSTVSATVKETDAAWRARMDALMTENSKQVKEYQDWSQGVSGTLVGLTSEFQQVGLNLKALQESLDTTTTSQRAMAEVLKGALQRPMSARRGLGRWLLVGVLIAVAATAVEISLLGDPLGLGPRLQSIVAYFETLIRGPQRR